MTDELGKLAFLVLRWEDSNAESQTVRHQSWCRRVAEVDPSLAGDVDRELARMRQKEAEAERRQKKQWKGAFSR